MSTKRGKRMKLKQSGHKNNYMDNLSGKLTGKWSEGRWGWLRKECLKRTDEVLIMAVQEQVIRSNNIKTKTEEPRK